MPIELLKHPSSRREFIASLGVAGGISRLTSTFPFRASESGAPLPLKVSIFSKHLQFLDIRQMAQAASQLGFDGVDLAVRPGAHIAPEKVQEDLPKAVEMIRREGVEVPMVTTAIADPQSPYAESILRTGAWTPLSIVALLSFTPEYL